MKLNGKLVLFTVFLVVLATLCKYLFAPQLSMSGFSPMIAIALFSGMIVKDKNQAFLLPLVALIASDILIELFYQAGWFPFAGLYKYQLLNYTLLILVALIGWAIKGKSLGGLFLGAIVAPTIYFLLSNLTSWINMDIYEKTTAGLMQSYVAGLPFYKNSLIATVIFLPLVSFLYNYIVKAKTELKLA